MTSLKTPEQKEVRDLIRKMVWNCQIRDCKACDPKVVDKYQAKLEAYYAEYHIGLLPEKRKDTKPGFHYRTCTPQQRENRGFNEAINQSKDNIAKGLK